MQSFRLGFASIYSCSDTETRMFIDRFIDDNYQYEEQDIDEIGIAIVERLHEEFNVIVERNNNAYSGSIVKTKIITIYNEPYFTSL